MDGWWNFCLPIPVHLSCHDTSSKYIQISDSTSGLKIPRRSAIPELPGVKAAATGLLRPLRSFLLRKLSVHVVPSCISAAKETLYKCRFRLRGISGSNKIHWLPAQTSNTPKLKDFSDTPSHLCDGCVLQLVLPEMNQADLPCKRKLPQLA